MKRTILISMFLICAIWGLTAQTISNVRSELDLAGYYRITFDLGGKSGELYVIRVTPYAGSREVTNPRYASGAGIKTPIAADRDLQIFWNPFLEGVGRADWQFRLIATLSPMVYVEGGSFVMGSNDGERDEKPGHQVTVSSFLIGKYEVTQNEWKEIMGNNPSNTKGDELPVGQVSWNDVVDYCNKRSLREGLTPCYSGSDETIRCDWYANGYRLPTEAEWEYAARGGNQSVGYEYSGSNDFEAVAWYEDNAGSTPHAVGTKQSNELGIYDMSGNVWEWCWDWYDSEYYSISPSSDPRGVSSESSRVLRGGSWFDYSEHCRVSIRNHTFPFDNYDFFGFRVSRLLSEM